MPTDLLIPTRTTGSYLFTFRQFLRMQAAGIFGDDKVELVAGRIYPMTEWSPHIFAVGRFHEGLRPMLPRDRWTIREEKPILFGRYWAPRPDIAVLRGSDENHATRLPERATSPCSPRSPTQPIIATAGGSGGGMPRRASRFT